MVVVHIAYGHTMNTILYDMYAPMARTFCTRTESALRK